MKVMSQPPLRSTTTTKSSELKAKSGLEGLSSPSSVLTVVLGTNRSGKMRSLHESMAHRVKFYLEICHPSLNIVYLGAEYTE